MNPLNNIDIKEIKDLFPKLTLTNILMSLGLSFLIRGVLNPSYFGDIIFLIISLVLGLVIIRFMYNYGVLNESPRSLEKKNEELIKLAKSNQNENKNSNKSNRKNARSTNTTIQKKDQSRRASTSSN